MKSIVVVVVLLLTACSSSSDHEFSRTLHVTAEKLAEIKRKPYVKRYQSGGGPALRFSSEPWPEGISFIEFGPYLESLGFAKRQMLVAIDGKDVHAIFDDSWEKISSKRRLGANSEFYEELIRYLFDKEPGDSVVVTMYVNVPSRVSGAESYSPEIEYWQLVFDK